MSAEELTVKESLMKFRKAQDKGKTGELRALGTSLAEICLLAKFPSELRRQELCIGLCKERGNLLPDDKGKIQVGPTYKYESTDAGKRDGTSRSSDEVPVMGMERRGRIFPADDARKLLVMEKRFPTEGRYL